MANFIVDSKPKFTKRLAESTIKAGLVLVNGQVALDSSRILKVQDSVTVMDSARGNIADGECKDTNEKGIARAVTIHKLASNNSRVEIIKRKLISVVDHEGVQSRELWYIYIWYVKENLIYIFSN